MDEGILPSGPQFLHMQNEGVYQEWQMAGVHNPGLPFLTRCGHYSCIAALFQNGAQTRSVGLRSWALQAAGDASLRGHTK